MTPGTGLPQAAPGGHPGARLRLHLDLLPSFRCITFSYITPRIVPGSYLVFLTSFVFELFLSGSWSSYIKMSSASSSGEEYIARRLRQIQQDINQGTFMGWATEEEISARREDKDRNLREEIRRTAPRQSAGSRPSNTTFVGSINPQRV